MDLTHHYQSLTFNHDFGFKQYVTPHTFCDPKRQIIDREWADYKHKRSQGKFKVTTKPKVSYFEEMIKPIKNNPAPNYKVEGEMIRRTKSASIKKPKVDLNVKRGTFIDQIELYEKKNKTPGVGKLDLTKYSSIKKAKSSPAKDMRESNRIRNNNFDDDIRRAVEVPGPGDFNPHISIRKFNKDRSTYKDWQAKHKQQGKKLQRSESAKLSPFTYNPIVAGTFSSRAADKSNRISRWSHGKIEVRKGSRSQQKNPSPSQYNTINQWAKTNEKEKEKKIGHWNLLNRVTTARSFSVYH